MLNQIIKAEIKKFQSLQQDWESSLLSQQISRLTLSFFGLLDLAFGNEFVKTFAGLMNIYVDNEYIF